MNTPDVVDGPVRRPHYAASITGNTNSHLWKQGMHALYGLKPIYHPRENAWISAARTPRIVASAGGALSRVDASDWRGKAVSYPLWDHARAWQNSDGDPVITLEPWGSPIDSWSAWQDLRAKLFDNGVELAFEGVSPYGASYIVFLASADSEWGSRFRAFRCALGVMQL